MWPGGVCDGFGVGADGSFALFMRVQINKTIRSLDDDTFWLFGLCRCRWVCLASMPRYPSCISTLKPSQTKKAPISHRLPYRIAPHLTSTWARPRPSMRLWPVDEFNLGRRKFKIVQITCYRNYIENRDECVGKPVGLGPSAVGCDFHNSKGRRWVSRVRTGTGAITSIVDCDGKS